ncbi:uncharacterized protein BO87DRAFT_205775 [Aspergillus neoniger CBS 115656]|uniref:Transmembrane protein n=1 Tax=Aspergillus neoniger (strain CBS 115656) TaxID=1448310 RepID=A0A318YTP2_ASPNB|nr:hypothetical protein BO87DRAFT_205775 [Aspergillus neoniger CBS 115656]PYH37357.1 hypothetical protein BO87DRAFT_205775 [Aspergillus neoniger CBS 115656]
MAATAPVFGIGIMFLEVHPVGRRRRCRITGAKGGCLRNRQSFPSARLPSRSSSSSFSSSLFLFHSLFFSFLGFISSLSILLSSRSSSVICLF